MQKEQLLEYMESDIYRALTAKELSEVFDVSKASEFRDFIKLLNEMEDDGEIVRNKNDRYGLPEQMHLVAGKLQMKARGFGFVIPDTDGETDVYIPATEMNGAMSGDRVLARVENSGKGGPHREGVIAKVVDRANERIVGRMTIYPKHAFVHPIDKRFQQDILIPKDEIHDGHDGYIVVVELTSFPSATQGPVGKVVEVLGHPDEPGVDIISVIRKYGLPEQFAENVLQAAEAIPLDIDEKELANRRDLRDEIVVTIDGDDAKDLDDAVHVKELANGNFELGVHIADVGYYVKEGGIIDKEAFRRGTSVYLVDRVIPMLPQRLSNNICSLNPQVDRLTMSCVMELDAEGGLVSHEVFPSVIKTAARMTYNNVRDILVDHDATLIEEYAALVPMFERMQQLALILREKRLRRGAVDFDFDEIYVKVNDVGEPTDIIPRQRSIAERLIEEFMLVANETVAEHFHWLNVPFVYRVHDEPDADKMMDLNAFLHNFGYHLKGVGGSKVHPRALQEVLATVEGTRESRMISTVMLRSMQQAKYKPECTGHFGLAAEYYTHFTSPIRRYPDLTIHRIMREVLTGHLSADREATLRQFVEDASRQSSERERLAQDAEREVDQLKMVEFMQAHVDEEFNGIISSVTQFGLFVQLDNGVEGLIHISALDDDYYVLNERQMALIGERNRRVFRMGDPVRVQITRASKEDLQIDFALVEHFREGTFVGGHGSDAIVYDEDLTPKERKMSEQRRESRSSETPKRNVYKGDGPTGKSRRSGPGGPGTVHGGMSREGRRRDSTPVRDHEDPRVDMRHADTAEDMPYDEWDADFPDRRETREQAEAERTGRAGGRSESRGRSEGGRSASRSRNMSRRDAGDSNRAPVRPGSAASGARRSVSREGARNANATESHGPREGGRNARRGGYRSASFGDGGASRGGSDRRERPRRGGYEGREGSEGRGSYRDARGAQGERRGERRDERDRPNDDSTRRNSGGQAGGPSRSGGYRTWGTVSRDGGRSGGRSSSGGGSRSRNGGGTGGTSRSRDGGGTRGGSRNEATTYGDGGKPPRNHRGSAKVGAKSAAKRNGGRGGYGRSKDRG